MRLALLSSAVLLVLFLLGYLWWRDRYPYVRPKLGPGRTVVEPASPEGSCSPLRFLFTPRLLVNAVQRNGGPDEKLAVSERRSRQRNLVQCVLTEQFELRTGLHDVSRAVLAQAKYLPTIGPGGRGEAAAQPFSLVHRLTGLSLEA